MCEVGGKEDRRSMGLSRRRRTRTMILLETREYQISYIRPQPSWFSENTLKAGEKCLWILTKYFCCFLEIYALHCCWF